MEILNVGTATIDYLGGWSASVIIFITCASSFFVLSLVFGICDYSSIAEVFFIIGLICVFGAFYDYSTNNPVKVTTYQVILDDDVSYNEFVEKYKVIKQEGRIYTVYEKDKEN